ncbi:MAG: hypothetical protein H6581_00465 [Bacteroidia bacterium]|nr:hypothetical protein [Bacteroidia bacterium]
MGFTKALYYPSIDILDEEWLKNAVLFWDEINTIVPKSIENPYRVNSTQYLSDEGILKPVHVESSHLLIEDLTEATLTYLNTNEGSRLITGRGNYINKEKLPRNVRELIEIHPEKLPDAIRDQLASNLNGDGWIEVDEGFAAFYMTLLANKLCEETSAALLTNNSHTNRLSELVRLDNQIRIAGNRYDYRRSFDYAKPKVLAQGMITNLIIDGIKVTDDSSLVDIVKFKQRHRDELGAFRTNIKKLTKDLPEDISFEALKQQVNDIYSDDFLPAYNNLKKALSGFGIKWFSDNFLKVSFFSAGPTSIPLALLGLTIPHALLAGLGVSVIANIVSYNQAKNAMIRENPYSYLLSVSKGI